MLVTKEAVKQREEKEERERALGKDILRKAFGGERKAPATTVLEVGTIDTNITYELTCARVPDTDDRFYTVKVKSRHPIGRLESWLMSGVFWTRQEAKTYVGYLRSTKQ